MSLSAFIPGVHAPRLNRERQRPVRRRKSVARRASIERLEPRMVLSAGIVTTSISASDRAFASFLDTNQNIVVVGDAKLSSTGLDFAVLRYTSSGELDPAFGQGGKVTTAFGNGPDTGAAALLDGNGRIVTAGTASRKVGSSYQGDFGVARYNSNGSLDTQFDGDGKVQTNLGQADGIGSVITQPDGKIVAAGYTGGKFAIVRYTTAGTLDATFAAGGIRQTGLDSAGYAPSVAMHQGKILLAGTIDNPSGGEDFALARYNLDGSFDASFGIGGTVISDFDLDDILLNVAVDAQDRIVVAGDVYRASTTGHQDFAIARYLADGSPDMTFGNGGLAETDFTPPGANEKADQAYSVAVQPDGKIVAAGYTCYTARGNSPSPATTRTAAWTRPLGKTSMPMARAMAKSLRRF